MDTVLAYRPCSYAHNRLWWWTIVILTFLQWTMVTVYRPRVAVFMSMKWRASASFRTKWRFAVGNTCEIRAVFQSNATLIHGNSQNNVVLFTRARLGTYMKWLCLLLGWHTCLPEQAVGWFPPRFGIGCGRWTYWAFMKSICYCDTYYELWHLSEKFCKKMCLGPSWLNC